MSVGRSGRGRPEQKKQETKRWLTLNEFCPVWTVGKLLLEGVAARRVRTSDGGLVDLDVIDGGGCLLVGHDDDDGVFVIVVVVWSVGLVLFGLRLPRNGRYQGSLVCVCVCVCNDKKKREQNKRQEARSK